MLDGTVTPETWVPIGSALAAAAVIIAASVKGAVALTEIRRDLRDLRRSVLPRDDFARWAGRLSRGNPDLQVPEIDRMENDR